MADDEILSCEVTGVESFESQLSKLDADLRHQIMQEALAQAGVVLAEAQQSHAPVLPEGVRGGALDEPGELRDSVMVEVDMPTDGTAPGVKVGPARDTENIGPDLVGYWVEIGHRNVRTRAEANAEKRGAMRRALVTAEQGGNDTPAHPWMHPAFDESADAALQKFQDVLTEGINAYGGSGDSGDSGDATFDAGDTL
jgi:hypothetical protein